MTRSEPPVTDNPTICAFDFGERRIGMAVGNTLTGTSEPIGTVANRNGTPDWDRVDALLGEWQPGTLLVGWPVDTDGEPTALCNHVAGFIKRLEQRTQLPVHRVDERYSSIEAQDYLRQLRAGGQRGRRVRKEDIDAIAAAVIAQRWMTH